MSKIKEIRNELGLTQSEFANKFSIPLRTLQKWEQNIIKPSHNTEGLIEKIVLQENLIYKQTNQILSLEKKIKELESKLEKPSE